MLAFRLLAIVVLILGSYLTYARAKSAFEYWPPPVRRLLMCPPKQHCDPDYGSYYQRLQIRSYFAEVGAGFTACEALIIFVSVSLWNCRRGRKNAPEAAEATP